MNDLMKIRDVSAKYGISARTLRYYEDMELIRSTRIDGYAYRLYDEPAVKRLEQILILRKLNINIKDIQRVFAASGSETVLEVLGSKVNDIDEEVALLHELKEIIVTFIRQIENADFSNDSDVKLLYDKAKEIEAQLGGTKYTGNPSPIHRLFEVTEKLEEKAASKLQIPDNVMKRLLQNVYFIWGDGRDAAEELGRQYGIFVYHTCDNRWKYEQDADPQFQPGLCRQVPDYFAQDPEAAAQWEREMTHDFTPMVIMDLIRLTAEHDKIICENAIDIDSIIHYVTHAVTVSDAKASNAFAEMYADKIRDRDIPESEKEELIRKVNTIWGKNRPELPHETKEHGVKFITLDNNSTAADTADIIADYFGLTPV